MQLSVIYGGESGAFIECKTEKLKLQQSITATVCRGPSDGSHIAGKHKGDTIYKTGGNKDLYSNYKST
jgi:hypothetical protein